jgi:hypothetical protein
MTIVGKKTASLLVLSKIQPVLDLISKPLLVVLNSTKPVAGDAIRSRSVVVILGGKNPLVVELISNIAEAFAVLPSALIPTDCAVAANAVKIASKINSFFKRFGFIIISKNGLTPHIFSKGQTYLTAGRGY